MSDHESHLSLYGNIAIQKGWCAECESFSFVMENRLLCCGIPFTEEPKYVKRETEPENRRRTISLSEKKKIINEQNNKCYYCDQELGSTKKRNGKLIILKTHFDHVIPFSFSRNNYKYNFVASCHVCNLIKSSNVYETLDDAKLKLALMRDTKGYNF